MNKNTIARKIGIIQPGDTLQKKQQREAVKATAAANKTVDSQVEGTGGVAGKRLRSFIERIERMEEEKRGLAEDIKDIFAEIKGVGFDTKTVRKIVKLRKMDVQKRREEDELLDLYMAALGMEDADTGENKTPLAAAAE